MDTKPIIVEYLIIVLQEDTFCDSDVAFLKFLSIDSSLSISEKEKTITLQSKKKNKFSVSYSLSNRMQINAVLNLVPLPYGIPIY